MEDGTTAGRLPSSIPPSLQLLTHTSNWPSSSVPSSNPHPLYDFAPSYHSASEDIQTDSTASYLKLLRERSENVREATSIEEPPPSTSSPFCRIPMDPLNYQSTLGPSTTVSEQTAPSSFPRSPSISPPPERTEETVRDAWSRLLQHPSEQQHEQQHEQIEQQDQQQSQRYEKESRSIVPRVGPDQRQIQPSSSFYNTNRSVQQQETPTYRLAASLYGNTADQSPSSMERASLRPLWEEPVLFYSHHPQGYASIMPRESVTLDVVAEKLQLIEFYREYIWIFFPLHPAVFYEDNVRYYLNTQQGLDEICSLSLGISVAVCIAAALMGKKTIAAEYEAKSLQHLAVLCDYPALVNDFTMAMCSLALSAYFQDYKLDSGTSRTHIMRAIAICKKLDATNSYIYSLCLWGMASRMNPTPENMSWLEEGVQAAKRRPYFPISSTTTRGTSSYAQPETELLIERLIPSPLTVQLGTVSVRGATSMVAGFRLYRENVRTGVYPPGRTPETEGILDELLTSVKAWADDIQNDVRYLAGSQDMFPRAGAPFCNLLTLSMYVEYYRVAGDYRKAIEYAAIILSTTQNYGSEYLCVLAGGPYFMELVLSFLIEVQRYDLLEMQLEVFKEWGGHVPLIENIRLDYLRKLHEHKMARLEAQRLQQSESTTSSTTTTTPTMGGGKGKRRREVVEGVDHAVEYVEEWQRQYQLLPRDTTPLNATSTLLHHIVTTAGLEQDLKGGSGCSAKRRATASVPVQPSGLVAECVKYQLDYRRYLFQFLPLHPLVLDEANVEYYLSSSGDAEISSLAFSFYVCLAGGAMVIGHHRQCVDFLARAEAQVELLHQHPDSGKDFSFAMGIVGMVWIGDALGIMQDKKALYLDMVQSVCANLQALNSDVYIRYLQSRYVDVQSSESAAAFFKATEDTLALPYFSFASCPANFTFVQPLYRLNVLDAKPDALLRTRTLQQVMPVSIRNLGHFTNVIGLWCKLRAALKMLDDQRSFKSSVQVGNLVAELDAKTEDILKQQEVVEDKWPASVDICVSLLRATGKAEFHYHFQDYDKALAASMLFIEALRKNKAKRLYFLMEPCFAIILRVLYDMNQGELLKHLLGTMEHWCEYLPPLRQLQSIYS